MVRNKYFYYLFLLNATINLINYVPRILITDRFDGALMSILVSIPIGTLLLFTFVKLIQKFPGQGLPEIFHSVMSKWVSGILLFLYGLAWFFSSVITLVSFVDITSRYISPDVSPYIVLVGFLVVVGLSARLDSESIIYALEMILYICVPIIAYMSWRVFSNPYFSWDSVRQIITYAWNMPNYETVAAATFIFTGYVNMVVFNRIFHRFRVRHVWAIVVVSMLTLLVSIFAPIGILGAAGAGQHVYPAFSTVDALRIRYFIIERMIYVFYVVYMCLSLVNSIIHWHVGKELILGSFGLKVDKGKAMTKRRKIEWWVILLFSLITFGTSFIVNQYILNDMAVVFLDVRFAGEFLLIALLFYAVWRKRRKKA
ncbi:GerAB/ArcD/ProY family transporter [Paenibacillus sp. FSL W7-1279]|uniref:GerAB/ArcD/ProY family transporter n=1 Tax=unclassified Paenibacillus TaxID=185978 RepID=UPI00188A6C04|nr:GerAB/ArcD/ProY family transporter [Paenibacillus sp. JZ16]